MYMFTTDLISMGEAAPLVISVSYGWAEAQECSDILHDIKVCKAHGWNSQQYVNNTDIQFMKFGASGRTFVVCSQDEGAPGETNDDCSLDNQLALYPEYPATSPYVTAVGATAILGSGNNIGSSAASQVLLSGNSNKRQVGVAAPCDRFNCTRGPQTELPCYLQNAIFTTGGGFSQLNPQPSYQQAAVAHYLASNITIPPSTKFNRSNRAYPDVGAIGQNVLIVMGGQWQVTGGTSASTPIVAGVFTLVNNWLLNNGKPQLGFVNPLLYRMAADQPNTFNKITQGANRCTEDACCKYGFEANPDGTWNPATGLGSPNYLNIISYLQQNNF
jgi:tripeptidyl-peptidase-1